MSNLSFQVNHRKTLLIITLRKCSLCVPGVRTWNETSQSEMMVVAEVDADLNENRHVASRFIFLECSTAPVARGPLK